MFKQVSISRQISDFKVYVWYITGYEIYDLDDYTILLLLDYFCRKVHWMCVVRKYWFSSLRFHVPETPLERIKRKKAEDKPKEVLKFEFEQITMFQGGNHGIFIV